MVEIIFYVGNFGDGNINIYDMAGHFKSTLRDEQNKAISIEGLWALKFVSFKLYFTAGPEDEEHGLFGYLRRF